MDVHAISKSKQILSSKAIIAAHEVRNKQDSVLEEKFENIIEACFNAAADYVANHEGDGTTTMVSELRAMGRKWARGGS